MQKYRYIYILLPTLICVIGIAVLLSVGITQYQSEIEKENIQVSLLADIYSSFIERTMLNGIVNGGESTYIFFFLMILIF